MSFDYPERNMYVSQCKEAAAVLVDNVSSRYSSFLVFGFVFLISGSLLSIIAFYNLHRSSKTPVFGPLLLGTGLFSCIIGTFLAIINKKRRNEVEQRRNIYENFSTPLIQVREEPRNHCYTISKNRLAEKGQVFKKENELNIETIASFPTNFRDKPSRDCQAEFCFHFYKPFNSSWPYSDSVIPRQSQDMEGEKRFL